MIYTSIQIDSIFFELVPRRKLTVSTNTTEAPEKPNVLFLCTHNSARSQMAEALLRHYAGSHFEVYSAGLEAGGINPYAIQVMDEIGIDMRGQHSKSTKAYMGRLDVQFLISVCSQAEQDCPRGLWAQKAERLLWLLDDPALFKGSDEEKLGKFRAIRDQINAKIREWLVDQGIMTDAAGTTAGTD
jgi:arsenate reductase